MNPIDRERRFAILKTTPCLCCAMFGFVTRQVDIHHLNFGAHAGGERRGDEYTIPLCSAWHHTGNVPDGMSIRSAGALFGPSLAREPVRFREIFGSDDELLAATDMIVERRLRLRVGA